MKKQHQEYAFVPFQSAAREPWFALNWLRLSSVRAKNDFSEDTGTNWSRLKIEGWRIVKVKITAQGKRK